MSKRMLILTPLGLMLASVVHGASCDRIEDLDERLACFDRLAKCTAIAVDAERLACFEGHAPGATDRAATAEGAPAVAPSGQSEAARSPADEASSADEPSSDDDELFPVKGRSRGDDEGPSAKTLTANITRVRRDPRDIVYLYLDNGQVWRETARTKFGYRTGMAVEISTGMLGSTNLVAEGMRGYAKVRRVK